MFDFGLTEDQFWRLTPAKFFYLSRRLEAKNEMDDFRMAYVISTIVNVNRKKGKKAMTPKDFMPSEIAKKKRKKSADQLHQQFRALMGDRIVPSLKSQENAGG